MSTAVAEKLVGMSLKALGKGAGEEAVKMICSVLMGDIFGGGDNAEANAEILAKLDKILDGLNEVKDSLQKIEQAVARVDADIDAAAILHEVSTITSLYDSYFFNLKAFAASQKDSSPAAKQESAKYRARLIEIAINVKNEIPKSLQIIHDFVAGDGDYLNRLAKANVSQANDIVDFYSQTKHTLIKIVIVEHKAIRLLRFAEADPDPRVNYPDGQADIERAEKNFDIQEESLRSAIGPKTYDLVSAIITECPKPVQACVNKYEERGIAYDEDGDSSKWYGGDAIQMWHIEPADEGAIVTDGSKANGFRLKNMNSNKYLSIDLRKVPFGGLIFHIPVGVDSPSDAAVLTFHLTPAWKLLLRSRAYPEAHFCKTTNDDLPKHVLRMSKYVDPDKDSQWFTVNLFRGPINNFWPGNITTMSPEDRLYPGAWLDSPNRHFRLTFEGNKFGVWDQEKKSWKWDSGVCIDTSNVPYVRFDGLGILYLYQGSKTAKYWGPLTFPMSYHGYVLGVTDQGVVQIVRSDNGHCKWSSE